MSFKMNLNSGRYMKCKMECKVDEKATGTQILVSLSGDLQFLSLYLPS